MPCGAAAPENACPRGVENVSHRSAPNTGSRASKRDREERPAARRIIPAVLRRARPFVFALLVAACHDPDDGGVRSGSSTPSASISPSASAAPSAIDPAREKALLARLRGNYQISSSRKDSTAFEGATLLRIEENVLSYRRKSDAADGPSNSEVRKTVRVLPASTDDEIWIELDHRGDFRLTDALNADAVTVHAVSKGWSRQALVRFEHGNMQMALGLPQQEPPTTVTPSDSVEVLTLGRVDDIKAPETH
jgi:hypothetical protein